MEPRFRRGFTAVEKKELWDRWQRGESFEGDRSSVWEAVIVCLFPGGPVRGYPSCSKASLEAGISAFGAGGDFQRHYGASISPIDSQSAGSLAFNGEPGD